VATDAFVDTNVLVYAFDVDEPRKREVALRVLEAEGPNLTTSAQVLAEFYVVVTRRLRRPLSPAAAQQRVDELASMPIVAVDATLVRSAIELSQTEGLSYWDAAIVAAASAAGCDRLLTEDLAEGRTIAGFRVDNPFADT
jgi:predicted nucleic acid-binding protein